MLAEMVEDFFFGYLPKGVRRFLDENTSAALLYYVMSEGTKDAVGKKMKEGGASVTEALKTILDFYKMMGGGDCEVEEKERGMRIRVTKCFHEKFLKENGRPVCVACVAALAGVLKAYFGFVEVEVEGRKMGSRSDVKVVKKGNVIEVEW
jgi:predicted hydrocarbon binding protein